MLFCSAISHRIRARMVLLVAPLFLFYQIAVSTAKQCGKEYSNFGMMLKRHDFKKIKTSTSLECLQACRDDIRCQSLNYVISQDMCELNDRTKDARPEDFVPDSHRYYFTRDKNRGESMHKKTP